MSPFNENEMACDRELQGFNVSIVQYFQALQSMWMKAGTSEVPARSSSCDCKEKPVCWVHK